MSRTALIVGAGIGGLSAGIALRNAGWRVRLFERAASLREIGFGLAVAPNAVAALRDLGVANTVLARAHAPEMMRGELRRMDGTPIKRVELPVVAAMGGRMAVALRPALYGALLDEIGPDSITVSADAAGFTEASGRVTLHFAAGDPIEGDLLVGADGIGSVIRRALHPDEAPPRSSGIVAVRGAVHGAVQHLHGLTGVYYLGPGVESVVVRASETGIYWFLSLAREVVPAGMTDPSAILAHMAPRFDRMFQDVTAMTEEMRFDELFDRDPLPFWSRGRVTLLGDAAHPLLPHTGQGAAQAMTDAVTLGRLLSGPTDVAAALTRYETERRPKTTALLYQGRRTAWVMRIHSPLGCAIREAAIRMVPVKTLTKMVVRINRRAGTKGRP